MFKRLMIIALMLGTLGATALTPSPAAAHRGYYGYRGGYYGYYRRPYVYPPVMIRNSYYPANYYYAAPYPAYYGPPYYGGPSGGVIIGY